MKKFLNVLTVLTALLVGTNLLVSCDNDPLEIGDELVGGGASGSSIEYDVVAYNTTTDTILSNQRVLQNAILGAYDEPVFGKNKARFYTQVRLASTLPSIGNNAVVDSVVLRIPVYYKTTAVSQDTIKLFTAPEDDVTKKDTILYRNVYELDSIYGNKNSTMTLNVREFTNMLLYDSLYYSNNSKRSQDNINVNSTILGTSTLSNKVTQNTIKVEDETTNYFEESVAYKVFLDKEFFQQKIIANRGNGNLGDNATFIRNVLRGLELSIEDENGFYFQFNPNAIELKMYYTQDNTSTAENAPKRIQTSYDFSFSNLWTTTSGGYTVQLNQFDYNRSSEFENAIRNPNMTDGASRLYLNGMDGTLVNVLFKQESLNDLKEKVKNNNWIIIGAKLLFNVDDSYTTIAQKPPYLFAWNNYKDDGKWVNKLYSDISRASAFTNAYPTSVHFNPMYNYTKNNGQYEINITDHLKNMIERDATFEDQKMIVGLGNFLLSSSLIYNESPYYNNRVSSPQRLVLHGNQSSDPNKKLKLLVYYTQK